MSSPSSSSQQQPQAAAAQGQGQRRLTLRELQERRRKAEEAFEEALELGDRWDEEVCPAMAQGRLAVLLKELHGKTMALIDQLRVGLPHNRDPVGGVDQSA